MVTFIPYQQDYDLIKLSLVNMKPKKSSFFLLKFNSYSYLILPFKDMVFYILFLKKENNHVGIGKLLFLKLIYRAEVIL